MDPISNGMHIQMPVPDQQSSSREASPPPSVAGKPPVDKTLSSASDLLKLLPTGTVLAFQALAPSFSNHGVCHAANRYLVLALVGGCAISCVLLSFTDSLVGRDGGLYYGAATFWGFYPFNFTGTRAERDAVFKDLCRYRVTPMDFVHAIFSAVVFLAVAFADASIQSCLFPDAGPDLRELLVNLPLAAGFLASMVFMIFPTTRKSIGYTDMMPHSH
ncbi:protein DMP2 [Lolium perenne]|uniref:protein DMP2 n=1 Tax=Lolium perenne TaxID=4522 RepID=UPI0021EA403B|nr:protein DMP2-like [Lolium perenne]